jgi:hypothetical protein
VQNGLEVVAQKVEHLHCKLEALSSNRSSLPKIKIKTKITQNLKLVKNSSDIKNEISSY